MAKIVLEIKDENIDSVMSILENLKDGLISSITLEGKQPVKSTKYQPKQNTIIRENETPQGKYIDPAAYKKRLKKKS